MRLWNVALLLNLAIIVTGAWGWVAVGRHVERLRGEVAEARASAPAASASGAWPVVVRAILPEVGVVILSHEEITDSFRHEWPQAGEQKPPGRKTEACERPRASPMRVRQRCARASSVSRSGWARA